MGNEIASAITDDNARHDWVCNYAADGLLVSYDEHADTSGGANKCALISAVCLGKADGESTAAATNEPEPPALHAGCDVSQRRAAGGPAALLLLVAAALLWARRGGRV